ncbi:MAG: hypothetical protein HQ582_04115 [Planctomycetes bacterium]|nr:hypothetical protein [Planctomycetota bacterium]
MKTSTKLAKECSASIRQDYGFVIPWEIIATLVEWIMAECFKTEAAFLQAAESPNGWQMFRLHWRARRVLRGRFRGRFLRQAANALTDGVLEMAADTPEDKLKDVFRGTAG